MSWKEDYIARHGQEAYDNMLERRKKWGQELPGGEKQRSQDIRDADPEKYRAYCRERGRENPEINKAKGREVSRKGGKYYEKKKIYKQTGISGERERVRMRDSYQWRPYKRIIAPQSQLHHQWCPQSASYTGLALVEADQHTHGFINVIEILDGKITLLTEREIQEQKM